MAGTPSLSSMERVPDIGIVSDGKPGHLNQSLGLADALRRLRPELTVREYPAMGRLTALYRLLVPDDGLRGTRLLIGAGHHTHLSLLAMRRGAGCPAVVLMSPSLPERWFDLCIPPRHDGDEETAQRWLSDGPLNRMRPSTEPRKSRGLILVGGPSSHFHWSEAAILGQITRLCDGESEWTLSTSRRTPSGFLRGLAALELPGLQIHRMDEQVPGWLAAELPTVQHCWVTPDSASMVYEALSAGCAVGVFDLPARPDSRIATSLRSLADRGILSHFQTVDLGGTLTPLNPPFAEADRMAQRIVERGWF
ncbi:MAG: ELM1/GtrOC1 family putative glycosyltransferase [Pseudomonadota bacterium]